LALVIYYDGDCPFCRRYVRYLRLDRTVGSVTLEDVRQNPEARLALERQGFNLDEGMVVDMDGRRVGGADAVNALALLSTPVGVFNRLNRLLLASPRMSRFLYPVLRSGRWAVLFLLGRRGFTDDDAGTLARTAIFARFFALFSFFHFFNYSLEYGRFPPGLDQLALVCSAIALFFWPRSSRLLWLLMLTSAISAAVQAPVQSNHTMVRNVVVAGYWLSFAMAMFRGSNWQAVFQRFAPAGQGALLVMYFFGIFHKLNSDFLNPASSCAVVLWREMPVPLRLLEGRLVDLATIYGTLVIEGLLIAMLLNRRLRHLGIAIGILFHLLLAMSNYAMYISFTMLAIALHSLFLGDRAATVILGSSEMQLIQSRLRDPVYIVALLVLAVSMALAAATGANSLVTLLMLPVILPFCWLVMRYGKSGEHLLDRQAPLSMNVVGGAITVLFFANCLMPYLGLKSAQAVNMYANLRLEGGVSNHLIMPVPGPFNYLEQVAVVEDAGSDSVLEGYRRNGFAIVYYDLLARLSVTPDNTVTFTLDGDRFEQVRAEDFSEQINATVHPVWFRKWFHFQPVELGRPEHCKN